MTDRNEMNESNELDEQELEQAAGGIDLEDIRHALKEAEKRDTILYRCPKCYATKRVQTRKGLSLPAPPCRNCLVQMEKM